MAGSVLILYDAACGVCRLLGSLLAADSPAHWQVTAWQKFPDPELGPPSMLLHPDRPPELALRRDGVWLEGESAWQFLLDEQPRLQAFQHLAARVGLTSPLNAKWLRRIGQGLRRLCPACSPRSSARRTS